MSYLFSVLPAPCRHNETIRDRTICRQDAGSTLARPFAIERPRALFLPAKLLHQPQNLLANAKQLGARGIERVSGQQTFGRDLFQSGLRGMQVAERALEIGNHKGSLARAAVVSESVERAGQFGAGNLEFG